MLQFCHAGQDTAKQDRFTGRPGIVALMTVADLKAHWPASSLKCVARELQKPVHAMDACAICKNCSLPSIDGLHQFSLDVLLNSHSAGPIEHGYEGSEGGVSTLV